MTQHFLVSLMNHTACTYLNRRFMLSTNPGASMPNTQLVSSSLSGLVSPTETLALLPTLGWSGFDLE